MFNFRQKEMNNTAGMRTVTKSILLYPSPPKKKKNKKNK